MSRLKHEMTQMFTNGCTLDDCTEPKEKNEYHEMYGIISIVIDELKKIGVEIDDSLGIANGDDVRDPTT